MTINPISYTEILSWSSLNRIELRPWEIKSILGIDKTFIRILMEDMK